MSIIWILFLLFALVAIPTMLIAWLIWRLSSTKTHYSDAAVIYGGNDQPTIFGNGG
jgi:hypothetical protein